jgi:hypothetical protein
VGGWRVSFWRRRTAPIADDIGRLLAAIHERRDEAAAYLFTQDDKRAAELTSSLLRIAAQYTFANQVRANHMFDEAETFGAHFMPVHFYSIVPTLRDLPSTTFQRRFDHIENLALDRERHVEWLKRLSRFAPELSFISDSSAGDYPHYFWKNGMLWPTDAITYYTLLRELKPKRIIEIGSGNSTMLATMAVEKNGHGSIRCIEPYPSPPLRQLAKDGRILLDETKVQNCDLSVFGELSEGDVLFIDSSHICNVGSDVTYEILGILPALAKGVYVHIHDIFHPHEFPEHWVRNDKLFWNEQYLVLAFLAYNSAFRIEISVNYFGEELSASVMEAFAACHPKVAVGGSSLWIQKLAAMPGKISA